MSDAPHLRLATLAVQSTRHPYAALAQAVIQHALEEFHPPGYQHGGPPRRMDTGLRLVRAVKAGEFLLERRDEATELWFAVLGVELTRLREATDALEDWHQHLKTLRYRLWQLRERGEQLSFLSNRSDRYDREIDDEGT